VVSEGAPSLKEDVEERENDGQASNQPKKPSSKVGGFMKAIPRRVLAVLSNLPLAIGEMFTIAGLMALGIVVSLSLFILLGLLDCLNFVFNLTRKI